MELISHTGFEPVLRSWNEVTLFVAIIKFRNFYLGNNLEKCFDQHDKQRSNFSNHHQKGLGTISRNRAFFLNIEVTVSFGILKCFVGR